MHVLFISEGLDKPESQLMAGLHDAGIKVTMMASDTSSMTKHLHERGIQTDHIPLSGRLDFKSSRAIKERLAVGDIDIVHCLRNNRPVANTIRAMKGSSIPLIAYRGTMGNLGRMDPGSWMTYLHPRISKLVCVSNAVENYLHSIGVPRSKLITLYKGHCPSWYEHRHFKLTPFGIPEDAYTIGFAANMRPLKGALHLIKSAALLPPESKIHILMIGEVRDKKILKAAEDPRVKDRIHLVGFQADAWKWTGCCKVAVMPSLKREGLPRAVLEAMAQGVPAVVSDVGGMPELVEHNVSGFVVPSHNSQALAEAFLKYEQSDDLHKAHSEAAAERIRTVFSDKQFLESTIHLYKSLHPHD